MEDKKFNPVNKKRLNNPQRFKYIPIDRISEILNITNPGNLVDYGAGTGFFTFRIADLYPESRIFALDIEEQMIEEMYDTSDCENVFPLQIEDNEMPFAKDDLLAVWSIAVYHEMKNPQIWLKNVLKTLKPGAKLLIIDWSTEQNPEVEVGPPISHRVSTEKIIADLKTVGFKNIKTEQGFLHHIAIVAEK